MSLKIKILFLLHSLLQVTMITYGQSDKNDQSLKFNLNESGSHYFKATFLNQTWLRYSKANPGTTQFGATKSSLLDLSLRRTRIQFFGQITDRTFVYFQFGQNNFNMASPKQLGAFFHDALGEYSVLEDNKLKIGGGLTIASGLSRFTQPSIGTILTSDVPVFAQATTGVIDQFSRKLSIYARGQIGPIDYRFILSNPFQPGGNYGVAPSDISVNSNYASNGAGKMYQTYVFYQFFDKEGHTTPYMTGTYLGKKKILNFGAGFIFQNNAMWRKDPVTSDTIQTSLFLFATDFFLDMPLNIEKGTAISAYLGYFNHNYGKDYIRNVGVNNPYTGTTGNASFNGSGTAFPMMGTGNVLYAQAGYLFSKELFGHEEKGTLLPYASAMYASYDALTDPMTVYNIGCNYLISGHKSKLSLNYENRPVFFTQPDGSISSGSRRGLAYLQYQIYL